MSDSAPAVGARAKYSQAGLDKAMAEWGPWCRARAPDSNLAASATSAAIDYLQQGLSSDLVASLLELRLGLSTQQAENRLRVLWEVGHLERAAQDAEELAAAGLISKDAGAAIRRDYSTRVAALKTWSEPLQALAATADQGGPAVTPVSTPGAEAAPAAVAQPAPPPGPSLRELLAEHSVLILASLGAFLLVVATVLFELYGTVGLGGGVRFAAVVTLTAVFAVAGWLTIGRPNLRSVGRIYIALAAVLLPLIGLAAWTFLGLGSHGITVDQSIAVTAAACAVVYGGLARGLDLRPYGWTAGAAIFAAAWGVSGWVGGDHWRSVGLAVTPLAYAAWERGLRHRTFHEFQWFAHGSAVVAVAVMFFQSPTDWVWTATLGTLAAAYLAWQAIEPHWSRAWTGEALTVLGAAASTGPLGIGSYHFLLPMAVGIPLIALARSPQRLGVVGRIYRAHFALLHIASLAGLGIAIAGNPLSSWPVATALWSALALYAADFALGRTAETGYVLRALLPIALTATGRAGSLGAWTASLTAVAGLVYLAPFAVDRLKPLTRYAWAFFYPLVALVVVNLYDASVGAGRWEIPTALLITTAALAVTAELKAVPFADWAARGIFSVAWFAGVDALDANGWRGPFDASLTLLYTALAQIRAAARHAVASTGRRWFVHAAAAAALGLCWTGPADLLWWRLAATLGLLAVAYWWHALSRAELETPILAWLSAAGATLSFAIAAIPYDWQGAGAAGGALLLTGAWAVARRWWLRPQLDESGLGVLGATVLAAIALSFRVDPPKWEQAVTLLMSGAFLEGWSLIPVGPQVSDLRPGLRSGAAALGSVAVLLGAGVLRLDAAYAGLLIVALGAAHLEWNVQARAEIERWYALAAFLSLTFPLFFWPYAQALPGLMAAEFVLMAVLCLQAGLRRRQWYLAYPAALLLAPALHLTLVALGLNQNREFELSWLAGLAWCVALVGLAARPAAGRRWALPVEAAGATIAVLTLVAMPPDPAGIALLAYAPLVYAAAMQERQRWVVPGAAAVALGGAVTLLAAHQADTIYYAAALGLLGLLVWGAGRVSALWLGRNQLIDMHRYVGLGLMGASCLAGFFFPDRTGPGSLGAGLATAALVVTGAVLWLDAQSYRVRINVYVGIVSAATAGYFVARYVSRPEWQLVPSGLGLIAAAVLARTDSRVPLDRRVRQAVVAFGLALVMGWAAVFTVSGDLYWLVALLVEGAVAVGAGIVLRSRVLLAGGGAAIALVSLRALLSVAQAGYLFAAFAAVALVLLVLATGLAVARDRYRIGAQAVRSQLAGWE